MPKGNPPVIVGMQDNEKIIALATAVYILMHSEYLGELL
jgi:hypothetical protein